MFKYSVKVITYIIHYPIIHFHSFAQLLSRKTAFTQADTLRGSMAPAEYSGMCYIMNYRKTRLYHQNHYGKNIITFMIRSKTDAN